MNDISKLNNLLLIGFMGSGKTTVSKELAKKLKLDLIDMDHEIEKKAGMKISDIFESKGEAYFRDLETAYLKSLVGMSDKVISTGGGIVVKPENIEIMKSIGNVVFLQADVPHIYKNVKGDTKRPLLQEEDVEGKIKAMLDVRDPLYLSTANIIIQTTGKSVRQIADEIIAIL